MLCTWIFTGCWQFVHIYFDMSPNFEQFICGISNETFVVVDDDVASLSTPLVYGIWFLPFFHGIDIDAIGYCYEIVNTVSMDTFPLWCVSHKTLFFWQNENSQYWIKKEAFICIKFSLWFDDLHSVVVGQWVRESFDSNMIYLRLENSFLLVAFSFLLNLKNFHFQFSFPH